MYEDLELILSTTIGNDFVVEDDGECRILTYLYLPDDDEPAEVSTPLDQAIDSFLDRCSGDGDYHQLYNLAHELSRHAERLRDRATTIEDSHAAVADLYE